MAKSSLIRLTTGTKPSLPTPDMAPMSREEVGPGTDRLGYIGFFFTDHGGVDRRWDIFDDLDPVSEAAKWFVKR